MAAIDVLGFFDYKSPITADVEAVVYTPYGYIFAFPRKRERRQFPMKAALFLITALILAMVAVQIGYSFP
jgi:hypothetical protein